MNLEFPYSRQLINNVNIESVIKVLRSRLMTQGSIVEEFQNKLKNHVESKFAFACNSATSCLHFACLALGLKENDLLWTSPTSFVASANYSRYSGADVDFVDLKIQV